jgi:RNA polymerase sigma-70 factor (ECF subfamily)
VTHKPQDERELIEEAKENADAFGLLYDRYVPKIYSYILRRCGNKLDTEDLTSSTFEKAMENMNKFHFEGVPFLAWLYRIASNNVADFFRKIYKEKRINTEVTNLPDKSMIKEKINLDDDKKILQTAIAELPEDYQKVIALKFFEDLKNEEIAKILDCSKENLAVKVYRALRALREILNKK